MTKPRSRYTFVQLLHRANVYRCEAVKRSEIIIGVDGAEWIATKRQKTDKPAKVPLLPAALFIMEQHANHPQCIVKRTVLPVLSNQKMNAYLKEIADVCGLTNALTFHIARHTFATMVTLSNEVPIETVPKMLERKSIKQTQHYAKIFDKKISDDMNALNKNLPFRELKIILLKLYIETFSAILKVQLTI